MTLAPNPHYRENWEAEFIFLAGQAEKWDRLCDAIAVSDGFGAPRHLAALEQQREAEAAAKAARIAAFPTIAAYAAWRFASLPPGIAATPDFTTLTSIADADEAHARAAIPPALTSEFMLPTAQPPHLTAFADAAGVISSPRRFAPAPGSTDDPLDCIVSYQQLAEDHHFCLAHRWGGLSLRSNAQFTHMATTLARQAIGFAIPGAEIIFEHDNHRQAEHRPLIKAVNALAARLHIYRHLLPDRALKEQFSRITLTWTGALFTDPDWSAELYPTLPQSLRTATETFNAPQLRLEGQGT